MSGNVKIVVVLHEGDQETKKIWRFDPDLWKEYTLEAVVKDTIQLFPHIQKKSLGLQLYHYDDLAGKIDIESDADMTAALDNFLEELHLNCPRKENLVLHAKDIIQSTAKSSTTIDSDMEAKIQKPKKRKVCIDTTLCISLLLVLLYNS